MKAFFKTFFIILAFILLVWVNLPEKGPKIGPINLSSPKINIVTERVQLVKDFRTHLGLDLQGGSHLVFDADTSKVRQADLDTALESARDIIERRVNLYGVSEPVVQNTKSGDKHRITVDLPGITNVADAVALIGQTAQLSFRELASDEAKIATDTPDISLLTKDTGLTGKHVKKASVTFNPQTGTPEVTLEFTRDGAKLFADITRRNILQPVGIFIDEFIISAPTVQQAIPDGVAVISGNFRIEDAKQLAISINSGALPLPVKLVEQRNIGPTLGAVEVRLSVIAGAVGLAAVMFFMVAYYGRLGIIACIGLIIYGLISMFIFRLIPVVLTLPGIAGFILSIGMAVDSNILIFERIKEELREGREFDSAIRVGFGRAIDAIKDANITTLIVAFILFNPLNWDFLPQFGLVRGFALTLAIGVATSLFTGIVITRRLINIFYRNK